MNKIIVREIIDDIDNTEFLATVSLACALSVLMHTQYNANESTYNLIPMKLVGQWIDGSYDIPISTAKVCLEYAAEIEAKLLDDWRNASSISPDTYGMDWETYYVFNTVVNRHFYSKLKDKLTCEEF